MLGKALLSAKAPYLRSKLLREQIPCCQGSVSFGAKNCLFIKIGKPNQDTRFDVPIFGAQTLMEMKKAGIGNAVLESKSVIILEKYSVFKNAEKLGIGISGT